MGCGCCRKGEVRCDSEIFSLATRRMESPFTKVGKAEEEQFKGKSRN